MYYISNGELYHYGVPGMKWGQRKAVITDKWNNYRKKRRQDTASSIRFHGSKSQAAAAASAKYSLGAAATITGGQVARLLLRRSARTALSVGDSKSASAIAMTSAVVDKGSKIAAALIAAKGAIKVSEIAAYKPDSDKN